MISRIAIVVCVAVGLGVLLAADGAGFGKAVIIAGLFALSGILATIWKAPTEKLSASQKKRIVIIVSIAATALLLTALGQS